MISILKRSKLLLLRYGYWIFAVVIGVSLIFWGDEEDIEPTYSIVAFFYWSLLIFWAVRWLFGQIKSTINLKKEMASIELTHLQSQVSPHFFFNTLNNLYGLIDKDANKAKEMVLKLSDMMRYSIYDGQKKWVTLEEELAYLKNYIELHKARYHKEIDITLKDNIDQEGVNVMPLLFIILLENAFKHGVENLRERAYIHITLIAGDGEIHFTIENNFDVTGRSENQGIGLKNLKRRLELGYPKRHYLAFSETNNIYKAQLTLKSL